MSESICFLQGSDNRLCLLTKDYLKLQSLVKKEHNLNFLPNMKLIKELLNIKNDKDIKDKLQNFFYKNDKCLYRRLSIYFKESVDPIDKEGLTATALLNWFKKISIIYPDFRYSKNPVFTDMEKLPDELNYLNFKYHNPFKTNYFYYVFLNIPSNKHVGHWCGLLISQKTNRIYYYDSLNKVINPAYNKIIKKIKEEMKEINGEEPTFWRNQIATQDQNKFCGVYQLHFIIIILNLEKNNNISHKLLTKYLEVMTNEKCIENVSNFLYHY